MDELLATAEKHLAKNYGWLEGFLPVSAKGCWVKNYDGRDILDMVACYSALALGHAHPAMIAAAQEQLANGLVVTPGFVMTEDKARLAKELADFCGMADGKAVFMNSGAEAVETAMKLARKWGYLSPGKYVPENKAEIIFCENNFHGRTIGIVSASTIDQYKNFFGPLLPGIKVIPFGDAEALRKVITSNTVAFFVEPIQGEGGIVVPPPLYLQLVSEICRERNVLLVFDEIQTGFYRTGFPLACNFSAVVPDLVNLGKALGGGILPISAVVGKKEVMDVFVPGDHGSTFGGNPLACHVARAALRIMQELNLANEVYQKGNYFSNALRHLQKVYPKIKEVRGRGLLIGLEVYPGDPDGHVFCEALFAEGIICKETRANTLRFSPPLIISYQELDWALAQIARVFKKLTKEVQS